MFQNLVSNVTHSCFINAHTSHDLCIFFDFFTDAGDDFFSLIHGHLLNDQFRLLSSLNCIVHIFEDTMFSGRSICNLHFCHYFLYNILYHALTDWHEIVLL